MKFLEKLFAVLVKNSVYSIVLLAAFILFMHFTDNHFIDGVLTAISALIIYVCVVVLYQEFKKMPAPKKAPAKKPVAKKAAKKPVKKAAKRK